VFCFLENLRGELVCQDKVCCALSTPSSPFRYQEANCGLSSSGRELNADIPFCIYLVIGPKNILLLPS